MGRGPVALRKPGLTLLVTAASTLAVDQATKAAVRAYIEPSRSIPVLGRFLELSYVQNTGAAFGLMPGLRWLFVLTTLAVLAGIVFVWRHYRPKGALVVVALGLITGGAIGNLIDRVTTGRVTDFIEVHAFPVFNIADSGIVVGAAVLIVWLLLHPDDDEEPAEDEAGEA